MAVDMAEGKGWTRFGLGLFICSGNELRIGLRRTDWNEVRADDASNGGSSADGGDDGRGAAGWAERGQRRGCVEGVISNDQGAGCCSLGVYNSCDLKTLDR